MPNEVAKVISQQGGLIGTPTGHCGYSSDAAAATFAFPDPKCNYQYGVKPGQSFLDKVRDEKFDYVVLMCVCRFIMGDGEGNADGRAHRDAITKYCQAIRQAGSEPVFYEMGWGTTDREALGRERILELARENEIDVYAPYSTAWARVRPSDPI